MIAVQAVQTRRSVKLATDALRLSERAYKRELMSTIERNAADFKIDIGLIHGKPLVVSKDWRGIGAVDASISTIYRFPRDAETYVTCAVPITVTNLSNREVILQSDRARIDTGNPNVETMTITVERNSTGSYTLHLMKSLESMKRIEANEDPVRGPGVFTTTLTYRGHSDADVDRFFHFYAYSPVLVENPEMGGDWSFEKVPESGGLVYLGGARRYWESRAEGLVLRESPGIMIDEAFAQFREENRGGGSASVY